ncbi:hypothetical protein L1887_54836 [Cichorium endivia]|nr:hypothetical protein L1887_54836 [Cichorium endivia]
MNAAIHDKFTPSRQFADDESSINGPVPSIFGEGNDQEEGAMLFLVRELPNSAASTERFRQMGYRMTETRFLAGVLADRVAVQKEEMEPLLDSLKVYAKRGTRPVVQPGGVYCGLFGVRASTSKEGGLDVLVYNFARHQIPAYRLPDVQCITPEMKTFLGSLDQATMEDAHEGVRARVDPLGRAPQVPPVHLVGQRGRQPRERGGAGGRRAHDPVPNGALHRARRAAQLGTLLPQDLPDGAHQRRGARGALEPRRLDTARRDDPRPGRAARGTIDAHFLRRLGGPTRGLRGGAHRQAERGDAVCVCALHALFQVADDAAAAVDRRMTLSTR